MSLDEYNKKREEDRVKFALPPPRKVEEDPELQSLTKHVKNDDEEDLVTVKKKEGKKTEKEQKKEFVRVGVDEVLFVQEPRKPRPEREDRRDDRRGGDREDRRGGDRRRDDGPRSSPRGRGGAPRSRGGRNDRPDRRGGSGKPHSSFKMDENAFPTLS